MATVYVAQDPRFKREVAVKVLPPQFMHDLTFRARFEREAQIIAAIEHPAIVPVYDFGEQDGQPYLVMRYMAGGSLADRLKNGPLPIPVVDQIIARLAPALDEMHGRGIIHRDLKPGNILFDKYDNAFISDFGIARLAEASTTLTGDAIIGTPSYMSPEQARGEPDIDGRSDIYALGAIVFEMLTGKLPYQATTPMGLVMKHISEPVPPVGSVRDDLPASLDTVISQAMAKDRTRRFSNAADMSAALTDVTGQLVQQPPQPGPPISTPAGAPPPASLGPAPMSAQAVKRSTPRPRLSLWAAGIGILVLVGVCGLSLGAGGLFLAAQTDRSTLPVVVSESAALPEAQTETSPPPRPTSTTQPKQVTVFRDDFSSPDTGWARTEDAGSRTDYDHGSYRIYVDRSNMIYWATPGLVFEDVHLEVDATKVGGADDNYFGLICRYQDESNFYIFAIMSSGYYGVAKYKNGNFSLVQMDGLFYSNSIHQGTTTNRLRAECTGSRLAFYVNDIKLIEVEDSDFPSGDVGLIAAAFELYGTDILFDNFLAQQP